MADVRWRAGRGRKKKITGTGPWPRSDAPFSEFETSAVVLVRARTDDLKVIIHQSGLSLGQLSCVWENGNTLGVGEPGVALREAKWWPG